MTHHIAVTKRFNVSANKVWAVLADFENVANWHFSVDNSPLHNDQAFGLGSKRTCNFYDGTSVVEEIIEYQEGQSFIVNITDMSMPLKSLVAGTKVTAINSNLCEVTIDMNFVVKFGPLGWIMGMVMMKPMMKGLTTKLLNGLAYHAATQKIIGNKLPDRAQLTPIQAL